MRAPWPSHGLWRHADFLRLWAAQVGSAFGSRITRTVLPIIAILTIGASPTEVAVLSVMSVAFWSGSSSAAPSTGAPSGRC